MFEKEVVANLRDLCQKNLTPVSCLPTPVRWGVGRLSYREGCVWRLAWLLVPSLFGRKARLVEKSPFSVGEGAGGEVEARHKTAFQAIFAQNSD